MTHDFKAAYEYFLPIGWAQYTSAEDQGRHLKAREEALRIMAEVQEGRLQLTQGWQPIETAPRDGTVFLTFNGEDVKENCFFNYDVLNVSPNTKKYCKWLTHNKPTHWIPLPAAPDVIGKEGV